MKKRHNRFGALVLVLILCLTLLSTVALAATTKLPTPTDLVWGIDRYVDGGQVVSQDVPGCISWQAQGTANFSVCIYHADTPATPIWETEIEFERDDGPDLSGYYSIEEFNFFVHEQKDKADNGNYFFTIQALGDGVTTADSEIATSPTWAYTSNGAFHNNNGNSTAEPALNSPAMTNTDEPSHMEWTFEESTRTLTISGTGAMKDYLTYPYSTNLVPWESAEWTSEVQTVEIQDGITHIGNNTFNYFGQLTSIVIPDSVTSIGNTFRGCAITAFQVPKNVTEIAGGAFSDCPNLTAFSVEEGNSAYCAIDGVLYDITGTVLVKFPTGKSTSFEVPSHVTKVGDFAFDHAPLTSVVIPANVKVIGQEAFNQCDELVDISFSEGLTAIEDSAFWDCDKLKTILLPSTVTDIEEYAFSYCQELSCLGLPENATICANALVSCGLTQLDIPKGVSLLDLNDPDLSSWCPNLEKICVAEGNSLYCSVDGVLYNKEKTTLLKCPAKYTGTLTVLNGVTRIGARACADCNALNKIILPEGLTTIGEAAFARCRYGFELEPLIISVPDTLTQVEGGEQFLSPKIVFQGRSSSYTETFAAQNRATFQAIEMSPLIATPNRSTVLVNGEAVAFDAYTINQNNYFKLRDLAKVLSGTGKQFEVTWDGSKNAINMTSGQPYTTVGGEMVQGDGTDKTAGLNASIIYLNGQPIQLTAYTINQNNYFKLRDIGTTFNFDVTWDGARNTIIIDTTKGYTPD